MRHFYWERHPNGPFVTLIAVAATYLHPEADEPEALRRRARRADEGDEEMRVFKAELRDAILHPERLPDDELFRNVSYDTGSPGAFLEEVWWYLYRDEPVAAPGTPGTSPHQAGAVTSGVGKHDLVRTTTITSSLFERDWIPVGAEGVVLDTKPDGRCLVDLTLVTPAEDDMGVYGTDFGEGDYGEGEFPLVVLSQRQYKVIRARDRG